MPGSFEVSIETAFCAAHALREYKGATEPTHGHNFRVIVSISGTQLDGAGILVDFVELKALVEEEVGRLNYCFLNEAIAEFRADGGRLSPSAENIARVLFQRIRPRLNPAVKLASVQVFESPGCAATYRQ